MHILNIAEKPSIAKSITSLLNNNYISKQSNYKYCPFYQFNNIINNKEIKFTFTAVLGHLYKYQLNGNINNERIFKRINNKIEEPNKIDCWKIKDPLKMYDYPITFTINEKELINNLNKKADIIIIWTDNDREGEHIAREIADSIEIHYGITKKYGIVKSNEYDLNKIKYKNKLKQIFSIEEIINKNLYKIYRAKFSEVSNIAIQTALKNLTLINYDEVNAVDTRIQMDLRTGFCITRILTENLIKISNELEINKQINVLSYGSCQIPTLGFVVERFLQIVLFKSEIFYSIKIDIPCFYKKTCCLKIKNNNYIINWKRKLFDKNSMISFYEKFLNIKPNIQIKKTKCIIKKPSALNTTKLISLCSSILKISSDLTMKISEDLYTKGFISYPRTETNTFPLDFDYNKIINIFKDIKIKRKYCCIDYLIPIKYYNPPIGNKNDHAHLPIYPIKPFYGEGQEKKIFNLIVEQFAASIHENGIDDIIKINITFNKEIFKSEYKNINKRGFREIIYSNSNNELLYLKDINMNIEENQELINYKIKQFIDKTNPPNLLNESDLINLMDINEIGTDATIHEHIKKILDRKYILKYKTYFIPSFIGLALINCFKNFKELYKPIYRSEFEMNLKKIANSEINKESVLKEEISRYKKITECLINKMPEYKNQFRETFNEYNEYINLLNKTGNKTGNKTKEKDIITKKNKISENNQFEEIKENVYIVNEITTNNKKKELISSNNNNNKRILINNKSQLEIENDVKFKPFNDNQCECKYDTKRLISKTPQNMLRIFIVCKKEYKKCNYFKWEDELN